MARKKASQRRQGNKSFDMLWDRLPAPARGPKAAFSREHVLATATALADAEGLAAVTMSRLAEALRVTPMALYRYVPGKDALIDLMADAAMRDPPRIAGDAWRADIATWARANYRLLKKHSWLIEIIGTRAAVGPRWTRWLDAGLRALHELPLSLSEKMAVLLLIDGHFRSAAQIMMGAKASQEWADNFARMLSEIAGDSRYPALDALMREGAFQAAGLGLEEMFEFGLERLLDGVEVMIKTRR